MSILEVFCGFGMSTVTFPDNRIEHHVALDHDDDCANAFQYLRPEAKVFIVDSYLTAPVVVKLRQYDCVYMEFNAMTTYRALQDPVERSLMDAVFESDARYVIFVDSAKVKEHLHYGTYSKWFEMDMNSSAGYVRAVDRLFRRLYGYGIVAVAHDNINYTFLFEKSPRHADTYDIMDTRTIVRLDQFKDLGHFDVDL
jgi:hypothetical protein